jgi:hypothetical protein
MEKLIIFEWKKKSSVIFAVRVLNSERKLFSMYYSHAGDFFIEPLIKSNHGSVVVLSEPTTASKEQLDEGIQFYESDLGKNKYVSFHVSGVVKGPDFQQRSKPYEKGNYSLPALTTIVEVCEQRPADPGAYPEVEDKDRRRMNVIFLPSAPEIGMYPIIKIEFISEKYLSYFPWKSSDYLVGLSTIDVEERTRFSTDYQDLNSDRSVHR